MRVANELAGHFLRKASSLNSRAAANADVCPVLHIVTVTNLCRLAKLRTKVDLRQLSTFVLLGLRCANKRPGYRNEGAILEADACGKQAANSRDKKKGIAHDHMLTLACLDTRNTSPQDHSYSTHRS